MNSQKNSGYIDKSFKGDMERLLVVINSRPELNDLVSILKPRAGKSHLTFLYTETWPETKDIVTLRQTFPNLDIINFHGEKHDTKITVRSVSPEQSFLVKASKSIPRAPKRLRYVDETLRGIYRCLKYFRSTQNEIKQAKKIIADHKPDLIIAAEGTLDYKIRYFYYLQRYLPLKIIIIPYTVANWQEYFEAFKLREAWQVNSLFGSYIKIFDSKLYIEKNGEHALRVPSHCYPTLKLLGMLNKRNYPWTMNAMASNHILVDSSFTKNYFVDGGIQPEAIHIVGSSNLDNLVKSDEDKINLKKLLQSTNNYDPCKKTILCCPSPNQTPRATPGHDSYYEALGFFIREVQNSFSKNWNVIIKLHPRTSSEELKRIEDIFGFKNSSIFTSDLLSISHAYVSSVSATIRWALALRIPTINYDIYHFKYDDYKRSPNVHTCYEGDVFKDLLEKMNSGQIAWDSTEASEFWGALDGKGVDRINEYLDAAIT